jgi:allantoinase
VSDLVIRGAMVFNGRGSKVADVVVEAERIVAVEPSWNGTAREVVNAQGLWLLPGGIDAHVHSRDPGFPEKEDFSSLTAAAAAGGITTVADMPNTIPVVDSGAVLVDKVEQAESRARVDFALWGCLRSTSTEDDLIGLWEEGAVGVKAYLGYSVQLANRQVVYRLADGQSDLEAPPEYGTLARLGGVLAEMGAPLGVHADDPSILRELARPLTSYADLLASRPALAESVAVAALAEVAMATGCEVHIVHLSSAAGLRAARTAQAAGAGLVLETCPQYLWCTAGEQAQLGPVLKMNPPVRTSADQSALRLALREGEINRVATDHAPHTDEEKLGCSWEEAAPGSPGVETLYVSCLELARSWHEPEAAVRWVAEGPARGLGLFPRKGVLQVGADADMILVDPSGETVVRAADMHSRQRHGPLEGRRFGFAIKSVWSRGELVARDGEVIGSPGRGRFVRRSHG